MARTKSRPVVLDSADRQMLTALVRTVSQVRPARILLELDQNDPGRVRWGEPVPTQEVVARRAGEHVDTAKKTCRSYATATTVFGHDRTARNSRCASSGSTPNRTTRPPAASRDRTSRRQPHDDIQAPLNTRSTSTNMPWITKDYLHIKQFSTFKVATRLRDSAARQERQDRSPAGGSAPAARNRA